MDVGKVTNWFRNLRQSDRKRARQHGSASADEMDEDADTTMDIDDDEGTHASISRTATPSATSNSGVEYVKIDSADERLHQPHHSRHPKPC